MLCQESVLPLCCRPGRAFCSGTGSAAEGDSTATPTAGAADARGRPHHVRITLDRYGFIKQAEYPCPCCSLGMHPTCRSLHDRWNGCRWRASTGGEARAAAYQPGPSIAAGHHRHRSGGPRHVYRRCGGRRSGHGWCELYDQHATVTLRVLGTGLHMVPCCKHAGNRHPANLLHADAPSDPPFSMLRQRMAFHHGWPNGVNIHAGPLINMLAREDARSAV